MAFSEREIRAALRKKESQSSAQRIEDPGSDERKVSTVLRYCPHCNAGVDDDAVFCQDCGRLLSETPAPEQNPTEEAKGRKSIEPISPRVQSHAPRRKEFEEPWSRTLGIPKFGMKVFWGILFLTICIAIFSLPSPPSPKTEAKSQQALPATRARINYKGVSRFYFGSAGAGRVVVIDPKYGNEPDLQRLGVQLRDEVGISSQIAVYDDERAALMREGALDDRLSKEGADFHDRHYLGLYTGFGRLGYANFIITPEGLDGPTITIKY